MKNFLTIPTPCNENWDQMTPQEQGRHCDKCNLVVTDFTAMSNEEILQYLNKNTGKVCGRVEEKQLYQTPTVTLKLKKFLYALAVCFLPFAAITGLSTLIPISAKAQTDAGGLEGKIVNDKGEPVPFASVEVFEGDILKGRGKTNLNGQYKIKPLNPGEYTLKVSSVGYHKLEIKGIKITGKKPLTKNAKMILKKRTIKGAIYRVGGIGRRSPIDQNNPGQQKISGDEIRKISGG